MTSKKALPFFVMIFVLAGCFRQAADSFDTVDTQGSGSSVITEAPTQASDVTIIAPGSDTQEPSPTIVSQAEEEPTATLFVIQPTDEPAATATNIPPPTSEPVVDTVATATETTFITPEPNVVVQIPTATPTMPAEETEEPLEATPTSIVEEVVVGDCEYEVQPGDNPFRIALSHDVTVDALMELNGINPYIPIIQPGDILLIPDCVEGETGSTVTDTTTEETGTDTTTTEETLPDNVHVVASGETLLSIARQYGVTVNDILRANGQVTDPNRISPGMQLTIPSEDDLGDEAEATEEAGG